MKKALVVTLLSSCLLALLLAATSASAQSAEGFSVLTSDQTLWTFGDPSSLDMFLHSVVSFSLGGSPVSAAAGDNGGFVVAGSTGLATRSGRGWISFGLTGHRFSSVAFVPNSPNNTVVAFGVADGIVYNSAYFMRSLDGGDTWDEGVSLGQTEATGSGSIAFSGNLGFAAIGGLIFRSLDGGATWTSSYSGFTTFTKVAVRDSGLIVATGPGSVGRISLKSVNAGGSWEPFQLPTFNPAAAAVTGISFLDATNWVVTTSGGEIWRTDGQVWNRTFAATNISWVDVAFLPHWSLGGVLLAAGSVPLSAKTGIFALSWDLGLTWTLSSAQPSVSFVRVVAALPQPPGPSPSPSSSPSVSPSASSSPSVSPSASATRSPSASATPSAGSSPSATASVTPSASATPSPTASPSATASVSITPTSSPSASVTPTISVTPSATPSKGSSPSPSRTPSVTPSASRTPSVTPSKGSSPSPSPSPTKKKDDGSNKKLALGLGLGLGLGGLVALIGGAALFWYLKQKGARRNVYQAINTNDV